MAVHSVYHVQVLKRMAFGWLALLALVAVIVLSLWLATRHGRDRYAETGVVTRVVDGDTIKVQLGGGTETVRYIGIDTPESVKPGTPVECYAKAASRFNERLVGGAKVRLTYDRERRDRYGRLLAYVRLAAEPQTFVNAELVRRGYATTLTVPPNTAHESEFDRLEDRARRADRGLWAACR